VLLDCKALQDQLVQVQQEVLVLQVPLDRKVLQVIRDGLVLKELQVLLDPQVPLV
jgi:hypothetical protein